VPKLRVAVLFLAVATTAHGNWTIFSAGSEPGGAGVVHQHVILENAGTDDRAVVDLAIFSTKSCTLRVIQNEDGASNLVDVMRREKCLAGVNGGYFSPDSAPIGLLIVDGKMIAPLQRARLLTGVLTASARGVQILRTREFLRQEKLNAAVQCGPFLIDLGRRVRGLEENLRRGWRIRSRGARILLRDYAGRTGKNSGDRADRRRLQNLPRTQSRWRVVERILG